MISGIVLLIISWLLYYPTRWFFNQAWDGRTVSRCRFSEIALDLLTMIIGSICLVSMCITAVIGLIVIGANL